MTPNAPTEYASADLVARALTDRHRPAFHFVSPAGWLNDPNGVTQRDGLYHLFYQYNPHAPVHADIMWGHARSADLVHWEDLPIALAPSSGPDEEGCWSGVLVDDGGTPTLVYSGRQDGRELPCLATGSADLVEWRKDPANPVIPSPPEGLDVTAFRDHCVWREGDRWRQIVGSGIRGVGGTALLYESTDLREWDYLGPLLVGDAASGDPDSPEWTATMWECVDLFRPPTARPGDTGPDILVFSAWDEGRTLHPLYWSGSYANDRFTPQRLGRLDLGGRYFYAPQSFTDDQGRRVMFGWMQEGRSDAAAIAAGWSGVMSVPRIVTSADDGSLRMSPVPELTTLRRRELHAAAVPFRAGHALRPHGVEGDQLDLELDLDMLTGAAVELAIRASPDDMERTVFRLTRTGDNVRIELDRSLSSRGAADPANGIDLSPRAGEAPADGGRIQLRLLVDHSAIEMFVNGIPLATRVYPTRDDATGVELKALNDGVRGELRAWTMDPIWSEARKLRP